MFSCEICKIFKNNCFYKAPPVVASDLLNPKSDTYNHFSHLKDTNKYTNLRKSPLYYK